VGWREEWIPSSFKGVAFHVENASRASGRRGVEWEFPKRDDPYFEDLGRRARLKNVTGYVLGKDYKTRADALEKALESKGAGTLVHPTMRQGRYVCIVFSRHERKMAGGYAEFEMQFVEAGAPMNGRGAEDTAATVNDAATQAQTATVSAASTSFSKLQTTPQGTNPGFGGFGGLT
jgi:prophage DNA circulation protein